MGTFFCSAAYSNAVRSIGFINSIILSLAFIFLMIACPDLCLAQDQKIDSLKSLLRDNTGPQRGQVLYELAFNYADKDNKLAIRYAGEALKFHEASGDSLMIVKSGRLKSVLHRRLDEMDSSFMLSQRILPIAERNNYAEEMRKTLNGIALVYSYKAMYDKALATYLRVLEACDPEKNKSELGVALNNVGLVYFKLDNLDKALYYFNKSLALRDEVADRLELHLTYMNIGLCYVYKKMYKEAKAFTDRALTYCKDGGCPDLRLGQTEYSFGLVAYGLGQMSEAEEHLLRSYELVKRTGDEIYEMDNLIQLFQIYLETNNLAAAKRLIKDADAILSSKTYYTQGTVELYGQLAKVYKRLGNVQQVAHYQAKYIELRDSVYDYQLTTNLMKVEADYLERENSAKIETQSKILELSNDVIDRQRTLNIVVCIVAVLSIAIVVVLTQNVKQKRLANLLLEQKVKERTTELEANHAKLLMSLEERNQQVKRISSEIRSSMATIKGLCHLSLQDVSVANTGQYITKIERASDTLQSGIYRTLGISDNAA